jgi:hypothetical protein
MPTIMLSSGGIAKHCGPGLRREVEVKKTV